ncbi:MAG: DsbA family protein [Candidatus Pacebacteria bacterium]|jgi:protein-disulfide isomerase|nr:DsbA family protein [Candidatus Paceibacterota bacterium]
MKNPWVITGIIAAALFGGAIWFSNSSAEQSNVGVETKTHVMGNQDATVTLVEYSDLQCPACAAFEPVLQGMLEQYGDKLRFEYKHFPLPQRIHPFAFQASMAAEAAGQQDKFFEYHDLLYSNQKTWSSAAVPTSFFIQYASDLGLDLDLFKSHLKSSKLREKIEAEFAEGEALGVTGTPTFFLNGQKMEIESYLDFAQQVGYAIDPELMASSTATSTDSAPDGVRFGI